MKSSKTEISEATAIIRARAFVRACGIDSVPVDLQKFLTAVGAELRISKRLPPGAAGNTLYAGNRHIITINDNDSPERQRFTVLHEIAHIVLELPSNHAHMDEAEGLYSYARRPPEEMTCDVFAAECLLPYEFLKRDLQGAEAGFAFVESIAHNYQASLTCAASRVATNVSFPCAYTLTQEGFIRFVAHSAPMRNSGFWISTRIAPPAASVTARCIAQGIAQDAGSVGAHIWTTSDAYADVELQEEARIITPWNQALTLLWPDDGDVPDERPRADARGDHADDEPLLKELDGQLQWPGRHRRR